MFGSELWDGFDHVVKRVWSGKKFCIDVATFMKKKMELDIEYGKKLAQLVKSLNPLETGTCMNTWNGIKAEVDLLGKLELEDAERLNTQVAEPLLNFWKDNKKQRKLLRENGLKLIKDLQTAEQNLIREKKKYEGLRQIQDKTKEEYDKVSAGPPNPKAVQNLSKKIQKDTQAADAADQTYKDAVKKLQEIQEKNWDTDLIHVINEYGKMEEVRMNCIKTAFNSYSSIYQQFAPRVNEIAKKVAEFTDSMSPEGDLEAFVVEKKSGKQKPPKSQYEPYNSATQSCQPDTHHSGGVLPRTSGAHTVSVGSSSGHEHDHKSKGVGEGAGAGAGSHIASAPPPSSAPPPLPGTTSPPTPTASVSEVVSVSETTHTEISSPDATTAAPSEATVTFVRGLFDYNPEDPNELTFKAGDLIKVIEKDNSGWWQGELNGRIGMFPSVNWVEVVQNPTEPSKHPAAQCKVLFEYVAENELELTITPGETLNIFWIDESGWYTGSNSAGKSGKFPSNFVETI